jgi:transcription elongation factor GreA
VDTRSCGKTAVARAEHTDAATGRSIESAGVSAAAVDEVVFTPEGYAHLEEEYRQLVTMARPAVVERLRAAVQVAGERTGSAERADAQAELELVDARTELLERRLHAAHILRPDEIATEIVSLGSSVLLDDLDDGSCDELILVSSAESNPSAGRISNASPVGRAIEGHHCGDVVDVHAPHGIRHLRIARIGNGNGRLDGQNLLSESFPGTMATSASGIEDGPTAGDR